MDKKKKKVICFTQLSSHISHSPPYLSAINYDHIQKLSRTQVAGNFCISGIISCPSEPKIYVGHANNCLQETLCAVYFIFLIFLIFLCRKLLNSLASQRSGEAYRWLAGISQYRKPSQFVYRFMNSFIFHSFS